MFQNSLGVNGVNTGLGEAGIGYLIYPKEWVDRQEYIDHCFRTHTISIHGGVGYGRLNNVPVDQLVMMGLNFPEEPDEPGTPVVWVKDTVLQLPVVIGSLKREDDYYIIETNQYRVQRGSGDKSIEIVLDAETTSLNIFVGGNSEDPANLDIKLTSGGGSTFTVDCDGEISVHAKDKVTVSSNNEIELCVKEGGEVDGVISYKLKEGLSYSGKKSLTLSINNEGGKPVMGMSYSAGQGLKYEDEFGNTISYKDGSCTIVSEKIIHNDGGKSMVLGEELKDILGELIDAITKLTVPTAMGQSGIPINASQFSSIKGKLSKILSEKSKLD